MTAEPVEERVHVPPFYDRFQEERDKRFSKKMGDYYPFETTALMNLMKRALVS